MAAPLFSRHFTCSCAVLLCVLLLSAGATAYGSGSFIKPGLDQQESQDSVETTIERRDALDYDPTRRSLFPDFYYKMRDWREKMFSRIRLKSSFSYDTLGQAVVDRDSSDSAAAGDLTFSANWLIAGEKYNKPIYLSFRVRHRHAYGTRSPMELGPVNGLLWKTVDGFNDTGFQVPDLYFSQELYDGRMTLRYGQYGIDTFFDNHSLRSGKRFFLNRIFSKNPSAGFPSYGTGFALQWNDTRNWDFSFGGSNIQSTDALGREEINLSLGSSALFYAVQGGYNFEGISKRNARIQCMIWDTEENSEENLPSGRGVSLTFEHSGNLETERYVARVAVSEGSAALVDRLFMVAYGREIRKYDHIGVGFGTGRSSINTNRWQALAEVYYRWQVTKELIITPDLQVIVGQGLDHGESMHIVAGIRAGLTF